MTKRYIAAVLVMLVGICFSTHSYAAEAVRVEGKKIIFPPRENLSPVDISGLDFKLGGVPSDKAYLVGKVWRVALSPLGRDTVVETSGNYLIFTKWEGSKVEIFAYPTQAKFKGAETFLDCTVAGSNELQCERRGYPLNKSKMVFKPGGFHANGPYDMLEGDGEAVGQIQVP